MHLLNSIKFRIIFSIVLCVIYYFTLIHFVNFTNDAFFGGDTWEYQSMAVNFAKGHGIQKFGGVESFESYKFAKFQTQPIYYNDFFKLGGTDNFYRSPGYSFFLGIIYKIFGVNPIIAKKVQLLLLIIISVSLCWFGLQFWGRSGFLCGLVAAPIYLISNYKFSEYILSESLIVFLIFLIVIAFYFYERERSSYSIIILGIIIGLALLVKTIFVFLPLIIIVFLLRQYFQRRAINSLLNILSFCIAIFITVIPWSIYASVKSEKIVIFTTQGNAVLTGFNNEGSSDGRWHPESIQNNNLGDSNSNPIKKVLVFIYNHPKTFLTMMLNKIRNGFSPLIFLIYFLILFIFYKIGYWLINKLKKIDLIIVYFYVGLTILMLLIISGINSSIIDNKLYNLIFYNKLVFILFVLLLGLSISIKDELSFKIPAIFKLLFINFFLIVIVIGVDDAIYQSRFIKVMDFIFILVSLNYGVFVFSYFKKICKFVS